MTDQLLFQQLSHHLAYLLIQFGKRHFSCLSRILVNQSVVLPNMLKLALVGPKENQTAVDNCMDVGLHWAIYMEKQGAHLSGNMVLADRLFVSVMGTKKFVVADMLSSWIWSIL